MNPESSSPWPSIAKVAIILGCTFTFSMIGLTAGYLATKAAQRGADLPSDALFLAVLAPPALGAVFGFVVGVVTASFIRWAPRSPRRDSLGTQDSSSRIGRTTEGGLDA